MTPDRVERYLRSLLWFGVRLYDLWDLPAAAHACAMELIAMEANPWPAG